MQRLRSRRSTHRANPRVPAESVSPGFAERVVGSDVVAPPDIEDALGATDAVPETIEASLQLSEAALVGLGVATGLAIATIHEKRDDIRRTLQDAAHEAGLSVTHAVKAKIKKVEGAG